ncbi:MAG: hypothetical protein P1U32_00660 [Legionellaceae bacterium]|nr:hypothetical protein [Legionellaceae bacterium]
MTIATEAFQKRLDELDESARQFSARIDDLSYAKDNDDSFMGPNLLSKQQVLDAEDDINQFHVDVGKTTGAIRNFMQELNTETNRLKILETFETLQDQVENHAKTLDTLRKKHAGVIRRVQNVRPIMNVMQSMSRTPIFDDVSLYDTKAAIQNIKKALEHQVKSYFFDLATSHTDAQKAARKAEDNVLAEQFDALSGANNLKDGALQLSQQLETLRDRVATAPVELRVEQLKLIETVQTHLDAFAKACKLGDATAQYEHAFAIDQALDHALKQSETAQAIKFVQTIQSNATSFFTEADTLTQSSEHATRIQEEQKLRDANRVVLKHALSLEKVLTEKVNAPKHLKDEMHAFIKAVKAWDEKRPTLSTAQRKAENLALADHYEKMAKYLNNKDVAHTIQSNRVLTKTANLFIQGVNAFLSFFVGKEPFGLFSSRRDSMRAIQENMAPIQQQVAIDEKEIPLFDTTTDTATTLNHEKSDLRAYLQEKIDAFTQQIEQLEVSEKVSGKSLASEKKALSQTRYQYQHQALKWLADLEKGANTITPQALLQQSSHFASSVHANTINDKKLAEHLSRVLTAVENHNQALGQPLRINDGLKLEQGLKKLETNLPDIMKKLHKTSTEKGIFSSQAKADEAASLVQRCQTLLQEAKKLQEALIIQREKNGAWMPHEGSLEANLLQALIKEAKALANTGNHKALTAAMSSFLRDADKPASTEHIAPEMRSTLSETRHNSDTDSLSSDSTHSL